VIRRERDALLVEGAVTLQTVPALVKAVEEHLQAGVNSVDFSRVTDVDSSAVALALEWQRQAVRRNVSLRLENIPEAMRNLATLYGVAELMHSTSS
jgi:phospholipid transport system transporter-binding protein